MENHEEPDPNKRQRQVAVEPDPSTSGDPMAALLEYNRRRSDAFFNPAHLLQEYPRLNNHSQRAQQHAPVDYAVSTEVSNKRASEDTLLHASHDRQPIFTRSGQYIGVSAHSEPAQRRQQGINRRPRHRQEGASRRTPVAPVGASVTRPRSRLQTPSNAIPLQWNSSTPEFELYSSAGGVGAGDENRLRDHGEMPSVGTMMLFPDDMINGANVKAEAYSTISFQPVPHHGSNLVVPKILKRLTSMAVECDSLRSLVLQNWTGSPSTHVSSNEQGALEQNNTQAMQYNHTITEFDAPLMAIFPTTNDPTFWCLESVPNNAREIMQLDHARVDALLGAYGIETRAMDGQRIFLHDKIAAYLRVIGVNEELFRQILD